MQYGRKAERGNDIVREMRAMKIASGGMGEFRNDTHRKEIRRGQERKWWILKQFTKVRKAAFTKEGNRGAEKFRSAEDGKLTDRRYEVQ
ncbi:hypothetical protein B7P43_G06690 [Cryptotermes secundus]|uniref:Uncharacterized protein n=1 Tax=Cryptotermes secundus TaxID=105785 RepID=A0A2J7Q3I4_9NEOP|nr:hypothetical protein B7P43_G06690 [Cryptotermes secundus]